MNNFAASPERIPVVRVGTPLCCRGAAPQVYEKSVKGYVMVVKHAPGRMQSTYDTRKGMALVQPYLVLQVLLQPHQPFTFPTRPPSRHHWCLWQPRE